MAKKIYTRRKGVAKGMPTKSWFKRMTKKKKQPDTGKSAQEYRDYIWEGQKKQEKKKKKIIARGRKIKRLFGKKTKAKAVPYKKRKKK